MTMARLFGRLALVGLMLFGFAAARAAGTPPAPDASALAGRTWAMGFGLVPPRPVVAVAVKGIDLFSRRAEIAAIHEELPWKDLLGGMSADAILDRDKAKLIQYLRAKGLKLYLMADANDGLSRGQEAPQLRALGRSIAEPAVQDAYRRYVAAFARRFQPEYIGLAAETNLVRKMAPPALYAGVVRAANAAAADLRAAGSTAVLLTSVQVETAWGGLPRGGPYVGVERDFADFPFIQMLGLSSYPYLVYAKPEDIPGDYYSRLLNGRQLPVMIVEGGWTSASVGPVRSSPELQARYLDRLARLADGVQARGVIQLLFADLDLSSFPKPLPAILPLFTRIGVVEDDFTPKPALRVWDALYRRPLLP
jgi:hypothetical protein